MAMANESKPKPGPPGDLPVQPQHFWSCAVEPERIDPPPESVTPPAIKRLGPPPLPRGGFPLMGFLATVYDHIADYAAKQRTK